MEHWQNQNEEFVEDIFDMAQDLLRYDVFPYMPALVESDYEDSDYEDSDPDSGLDDDDTVPDLTEDDDTDDYDSEENYSEDFTSEMERKVELVMVHATVNHSAALEALRNNNGDILEAIKQLCPDSDPTMPLLTESDVLSSSDNYDAKDYEEEEYEEEEEEYNEEEYEWTSEDEMEINENITQVKSAAIDVPVESSSVSRGFWSLFFKEGSLEWMLF